MTRAHKPKAAVNVCTTVRIDAYRVISDALDSVGRRAVFRALKHRDESLPEDAIEAINEQVHRETMLVLGEVLLFDGDDK